MEGGLIDIKAQLHEREKELDALYRLSKLFTEPEFNSEEIIEKTADILKDSMQYQEYADVRIFLSDSEESNDVVYDSGKAANNDKICSASAVFSINKRITITVTYIGIAQADLENKAFLERERNLVQSCAELLANVLQKNDLETILRRSTVRLQQQTEDLEHKNIALREILSQYDTEKQKYRAEIKIFFDSIIYPEINKLLMNEAIIGHDRDLIINLKNSLETKFNNNSDALYRIRHLLTPRELEICSLIKNGMSTKEISTHLNISELTVERHRNTIRKKLKLNNSNINLTTYLRS